MGIPMQGLLSQLNSVPGVVGSMVCDSEGRILAQAFPPVFEPSMLRSAALVLTDSTVRLETLTGPIGMVDLRYEDARVVVKPVRGAHLLFLCTSSMILQPLAISVSVALPKLEALVAVSSAPRSTATAPAIGGQLYETVQRINSVIKHKNLDPFKTRGEIAIKAGFALGFIDGDTPDDSVKLSKLKEAASAVLGELI